jgi:CelD/BcsL family acetyltransferase involved in cellulose biosynthesis
MDRVPDFESEIYQQGKQLWIVTAWEDSQLVGIAPLMLEKRKIRGLPLKVLGTLGTPSTDVGGFLLKRNEEERILSAIFEYIFINHKQWDLLELSELSLSGPELKGLQNSLPSSGYTCIEEFGYHYYLSLEKDWDSYFDNLSKKFKKNLRRAVRKADELGQVTYLFLVGKQIQPEHLETIIKVNGHGNFPIIFNSEKEQAFLYDLYEQMHDCFQVYLLLIDQKAVAYEYGFFYNNRFEAWRAGFDTRVDPTISVGKLLSMRIIEESYERNYIEIDFLRGNESYKEDWEPLQREYAYIRVLQTRKPVLFLGYILSRIRATVGRIKTNIH